jgi:hypothetical protein
MVYAAIVLFWLGYTVAYWGYAMTGSAPVPILYAAARLGPSSYSQLGGT